MADLSKINEVKAVAQVEHYGEKLIVPEKMSLDQAIDLLGRRKKYQEEVVAIDETFDVFPWDGAAALATVLVSRYGWAPAEPTQSFFGKQPPQMVAINCGYRKKMTVPWGKFSLPGIAGEVHTLTGQIKGRVAFRLYAKITRAHEIDVKNLFEEVRSYLKTNSIYRGQAIKIRFNDDHGNRLEMPEPEFLNPDAVTPEELIYSQDVLDAIQTNLFTPITRINDCIRNRIPVKRGVLLGGTFGTGKTLAATVASHLAVKAGVSYIYCPRANELNLALDFASQYSDPAAVVFCEDIDRSMSGERSVAIDDILNIIDGIDSKSSNIITVLTTNNLEAIEPAMLRPGRLDAVIEVTAPDAAAVEKLIRLYGGNAIAKDADLSAASLALQGKIPAVIAETVKRAKLAQLRLQEPGTMVKQLSSEAITEAAKSMSSQLDLLYRDRTPKQPEVNRAFKNLIREALNDEHLPQQMRDVHEATV